MKRKLGFIVLFILGSVITALIDTIIGVSFKDVGMFAGIIHKGTYMGWGAIMIVLAKWSEVIWPL